MAKEKRKDKKGYMLRTGECQRSDGRYSFSYTDRWKKRHVVYANSLVELREKEKQIRLDLDSGIKTSDAKSKTINEVFDKFIDKKLDIKPTTKAKYYFDFDHYVREGFGKQKIGEVHYSDVRNFYYGLLQQKKLKPGTLDGVNTVLHQTFQFAVRDEIIRSNPTDGVMAEIKRSDLWVRPKRHALTLQEQRELMAYISDNHIFKGWVPLLTVLLGTGTRIGECLALRWEDIDLEKRLIHVDHNLVEYKDKKLGKMVRSIQTTKTRAGSRTIPMLDEVYEAFVTEYEFQLCTGFCTEEIDGYSGFIFATTDGHVMRRSAVNNAIHRIVDIHNEEETAKAKTEKRDPILIRQFSAHQLRHSFCSRLCENESNVRSIMEIMGHADYSTTMGIYAEMSPERLQETMTNLQGKIF